MNIIKKIIYICVLLILGSCEEPYSPPAITADNRFLVVEGTISSGTTTFRLSRTRNLSSSGKDEYVTDAKVTIESTSNESFTLLHQDSGYYTLNGIILDANQRYRLKISASGKDYLSDFVEVKNAPPVGDVTWESESDGVQIFVNTSDPSNQTRYYRWEYEEEWQFHSAFKSELIFKDTANFLRDPQDDIYECFASARSNNIYIGTPLNTQSNEIIHLPLNKVKLNSTRLQMLYSILVKQYAMDEKGFEYWQNLKKMTESVGTLFDPQPYQFRGNIKCLNDEKEIVLGYVSAGNMSSKRIFIDRAVLPAEYEQYFTTQYDGCNLYVENPGIIEGYKTGTYVPVRLEVNMQTGVATYYYGFVNCIDCRENGTKKKPDYWPQ